MREQHKSAQFLRNLIYDLKRDYGFEVIIVKIVSTIMDVESGIKRSTFKYRNVRRAIFLPGRLFRSFVYDLSYVATNKNFTTGAYFDPNDREIFFDVCDLYDFEITPDDRIIYNGEEYTIVEVRDFIDQTIYGVKMRNVKGQLLDNPASQVIAETITLVDTVVGVKT
jgi:hypothetical protein